MSVRYLSDKVPILYLTLRVVISFVRDTWVLDICQIKYRSSILHYVSLFRLYMIHEYYLIILGCHLSFPCTENIYFTHPASWFSIYVCFPVNRVSKNAFCTKLFLCCLLYIIVVTRGRMWQRQTAVGKVCRVDITVSTFADEFHSVYCYFYRV
jgi:hypothetical protein